MRKIDDREAVSDLFDEACTGESRDPRRVRSDS
jgi:hypothetical protein